MHHAVVDHDPVRVVMRSDNVCVQVVTEAEHPDDDIKEAPSMSVVPLC